MEKSKDEIEKQTIKNDLITKKEELRLEMVDLYSKIYILQEQHRSVNDKILEIERYE